MTDRHTQVIIQLFNAYRKDVRHFFCCRLRGREDVEDLTQETFLRAHRTSGWDKTENPKAYLMQIASNLFKDTLRKEKRNPIKEASDIDQIELECHAPSPEKIAATSNDFDNLKKAVANLSPQVRDAVIFSKFLNLTFAEVAQVMGISQGTVEKYIAKGLSDCLAAMRAAEQRPTTGKGCGEVRVVAFSGNRIRSKTNKG